MRLLDRYVLRELMVPLLYCLSGFLIFWVFTDLISDMDDFREDHLTTGDIALYFFFKLPDLLVLVLPIALLLALLYALTHHARCNELIAMRNAGLSLWRICLPYLGVGLLFCALDYVLMEVLAPRGDTGAEYVLNRRAGGGEERLDPNWKHNLLFENGRDGRIWRIGSYHQITGEMKKAYVDWTRPDGSQQQVMAERVVRVKGEWRFLDGRLFDPDPDSKTPVVPFDEMDFPEFIETPEQISSEYKVSRLSNVKAARKVRLTTGEILHYKWLHPDMAPNKAAMLNTQLHARLATPWTCVVVVLIAMPFGAVSGRRNVFIGVASSIFICFAYFVIQRLGMALGTGGLMSPLLAAWLPNVLFAAAGIFMTSRVR